MAEVRSRAHGWQEEGSRSGKARQARLGRLQDWCQAQTPPNPRSGAPKRSGTSLRPTPLAHSLHPEHGVSGNCRRLHAFSRLSLQAPHTPKRLGSPFRLLLKAQSLGMGTELGEFPAEAV